MTVSDYLTRCIKNNYRCQHCALNHNNVCFFAFECFLNDMMYFKEDDDECPCLGCFEDSCENCTKGDIDYDC